MKRLQIDQYNVADTSKQPQKRHTIQNQSDVADGVANFGSETLTPHQRAILSMQQTYGNHFVQRFLMHNKQAPLRLLVRQPNGPALIRRQHLFEEKNDIEIGREKWTRVEFSTTDILWHGNTSTEPASFKGAGQTGKSGVVKFVSNDPKAARGTPLGKGICIRCD